MLGGFAELFSLSIYQSEAGAAQSALRACVQVQIHVAERLYDQNPSPRVNPTLKGGGCGGAATKTEKLGHN